MSCLYQAGVGWSFGVRVLLRDFGPNEIIFMNVCVGISVAMVMLLRDFGPYGVNIYYCAEVREEWAIILNEAVVKL
jgi:uncharacterized YccA/Bax inhibitor family protein